MLYKDNFMNDNIDREILLNVIGDNLHQAMQWSDKAEWANKVAEYYYKAEALIEVLEIVDCGSIGGHDKGQPRACSLFNRWDWLYRKYGNPAGKRFGCDLTTYEDIKEFKF